MQGGENVPGIALAWNVAAKVNGWRTVAVMSKGRTRSAKARLKEKFFAENWRGALELMAGNDFFSGAGCRGWKASIDFFLRPDTVAKVLEGYYEQKAKPQRKQPDHSRGFFHDQEPDAEQPLTPEQLKLAQSRIEESRLLQAKYRLPPKVRAATGGAA